MACRDAYEMEIKNMNSVTDVNQETKTVPAESISGTERLLFGVDSKVPSDELLQNNLTEFEWVARNKLYPDFWGRNITGENRLTKEEIAFLHSKGCRIAAICNGSDAMETEEQGKIQAKKIILAALELGIPETASIFLELEEPVNATEDYMKGYIQGMLSEGYIPGFKANTDANYSFDREYSRGMQNYPELFGQSLIWAVRPSLKEYERVTTTHLIHPDNWVPYAPSGITRDEIAVWQYGRECHPIHNNAGKETSFNVNLVRSEAVILNKMF